MPRMHTMSDNVFMKSTEHNFTATGSGTGIDCRGYSSALFTCITTTSSAASATFSIEESADNSTWSAVGTVGTVALSQTAYVLTASINLKKRLRYLRATYVAGGSPNMTNVWALSNAIAVPVTQTNGTVYL